MLVHTKMMWFEDLFTHNLSTYMPFLSYFRVFFGIFTFFSANEAFIIYEYRSCSINRSDFLGSHREDEISSPCPSSLIHPPPSTSLLPPTAPLVILLLDHIPWEIPSLLWVGLSLVLPAQTFKQLSLKSEQEANFLNSRCCENKSIFLPLHSRTGLTALSKCRFKIIFPQNAEDISPPAQIDWV